MKKLFFAFGLFFCFINVAMATELKELAYKLDGDELVANSSQLTKVRLDGVLVSGASYTGENGRKALLQVSADEEAFIAFQGRAVFYLTPEGVKAYRREGEAETIKTVAAQPAPAPSLGEEQDAWEALRTKLGRSRSTPKVTGEPQLEATKPAGGKPMGGDFDIENPSTYGKAFSRVKHPRGASNGLVCVASRTVRITLPHNSGYIEKIDHERGSVWADDASERARTFTLEANRQCTIWFVGPVEPGKTPRFEPETEENAADAEVIDLTNPANLKSYGRVVNALANGLVLVAERAVRVDNIPSTVIKVDHAGGVAMAATDCPLVLRKGNQMTVWYRQNVTPDGFVGGVGRPDANGQPAVVAQESVKVDLSKNFAGLKQHGEMWNIGNSKGKGRVFMAHRPVSFVIPKWIAKVDTAAGPVFGGKTVSLQAGDQCSFWGKASLAKR